MAGCTGGQDIMITRDAPFYTGLPSGFYDDTRGRTMRPEAREAFVALGICTEPVR